MWGTFAVLVGHGVTALTTHGDLVESLTALPLWVQAPGIVLLALATAKLIDLVAVRLIRGFVTSTETDLDEVVLDQLHLPVVMTIALAGILLAEGILPADLRESVGPYVGKPTLTVIVLVWVVTLNRLGNELLDRAKDSDSAYASFAPVFSNILTIGFLVGGLFVVLDVWGVDVTPLLASAGIAGVAIGFAAKDTVANFFGGLALYFDRTYRVGDYIELSSGETGRVVKVGIRSTTLLTRDEVMVTVPNSILNNARIINQSAPKRRKRIRVSITVGYGTDLDEFEAIIEEIAGAEDLVLDSPRPRVRFLRFGDSGLEYQLRCWVPVPIRETKARHRINRELYRRLREADIEIPYPKRDVEVRTVADAEPPAEVAGADD